MAEAERTIGTPDTDTPKVPGDELGQSHADTASRAAGTAHRPPSTAGGPTEASPASPQAIGAMTDGAPETDPAAQDVGGTRPSAKVTDGTPEQIDEAAPAGHATDEPARAQRTRPAGRGPRSTADTDDALSTAEGERSASGEEQQAQRGHEGPEGQQGQEGPEGQRDQRDQQDQESPEGRRGDQGPRKISVLFAVAALAYLLDVISKVIVVAKLEHHEGINLLGDWLRLEAIRNPGAAFGMGEAFTVIFTVIAAAVIFVIGRLARKLYSLPWAIALGLLLGGALGNLTDRLFRSPGVFEGAVVDFIAPKYFAVFNLADSAIVCGGILIVLLSFRGLDPDGTVHKD